MRPVNDINLIDEIIVKLAAPVHGEVVNRDSIDITSTKAYYVAAADSPVTSHAVTPLVTHEFHLITTPKVCILRCVF